MGRKSLAKQRREELLDAFERCIVQYGLEGTSLEQVAAEAGMTRSIIRHYIGNRDDLVDALIQRIITQYIARLEAEYADLSSEQIIPYTLKTMFAQKQTVDLHDKIIIDVLMTAQDRYPRAKKMLAELYDALVKGFADDLRRAYPKASKTQCRQVAYALICLSEMNDSFMWVGMNRRYNDDARVAAEALLATLE